jgi:hypothetical protein
LPILAQPSDRKLVLRLRLEVVGVPWAWLEGSPARRLSMRPRFTAGPIREITPVVGPQAQQNPSDPVISESYQELGYDLADAARMGGVCAPARQLYPQLRNVRSTTRSAAWCQLPTCGTDQSIIDFHLLDHSALAPGMALPAPKATFPVDGGTVQAGGNAPFARLLFVTSRRWAVGAVAPSGKRNRPAW